MLKAFSVTALHILQKLNFAQIYPLVTYSFDIWNKYSSTQFKRLSSKTDGVLKIFVDEIVLAKDYSKPSFICLANKYQLFPLIQVCLNTISSITPRVSIDFLVANVIKLEKPIDLCSS